MVTDLPQPVFLRANNLQPAVSFRRANGIKGRNVLPALRRVKPEEVFIVLLSILPLSFYCRATFQSCHYYFSLGWKRSRWSGALQSCIGHATLHRFETPRRFQSNSFFLLTLILWSIPGVSAWSSVRLEILQCVLLLKMYFKRVWWNPIRSLKRGDLTCTHKDFIWHKVLTNTESPS